MDREGQAYVTGRTSSANFPTVNPLPPPNNAFGGGTSDIFVSKLSAGGNALVYSTYLGGSDSDTPTGIAVDGSKQTSKQLNLLEEVAYGRGNSETFFGARYEDIRNYQKIELTAGAGEQPANDPTSVLLSAGWRYFGKGLTASFVFSGRVAQEQVKEHGVSMVLRADL